MANKDLVVKMTINSNDFDSGLKNAKASMNKFNADAKGMGASFKNVIGGMTKAFSALGVAMAAKNIFQNFMKSTESMKDSWQNEIGAMQDSWKAFLLQVNNGNFQGFKDIISYARQARAALDSLGDLSALFTLDYGEGSAQATELLSTIQRKRRSGEDYSGDVAAYNKIVSDLRADAEMANTTAYQALTGLFGKHGIALGDYGISPREAARLARMVAGGQNADAIALQKAYNTKPDISELNDFDIETSGQSPVNRLREEWGRERFNRAQLMMTLGNITEEEKAGIEKILNDISARDRTINQMEKALNRYLTEETGGGGSSIPTSSPNTRTPVDLIPSLSPLPPIQTMDEGLSIIEKINASMKRQAEIDQENAILMQVGNMLYQQRIDELNAYGNAIGYLGQAFSSLQTIAADDSAWSKFAGTMGGVIGQIVSLISTYTALVGIEAVAESIKAGNGIPFPYNLVLIAAAGAALAGIIATISAQTKSQFAGSYEQGGIVPGSSYTGDRLWVRVNSGEMILNRNQQAQLFGGGNASNVHFIIEGSQLKGVLDNYDKTSSL